MEFNLLSLLGISLAAMFFGYFFGLFEGRGQGYKKRKSEEPLEKVASTPAPLLTPSPSAASVGESSVLKLSLDEKEQPHLDLDGRRVDTGQLAPEQRKRLIALILIMRPWVEGVPGSSPPARPITAEPAQTSLPNISPNPVVGPIIQPPVPALKPTTMVGQIDAILQSRILGTPLANRGVRLVESGGGGVVVMLGLKRFSGIGDVTDPDVQAAIRSAIAEWEEKYTPG